jgi:L-asparagine transporter-like permease
MFRDAGQIMDDDDARRLQKFVLAIIRVIIVVALISYATWILVSAFASTKR